MINLVRQLALDSVFFFFFFFFLQFVENRFTLQAAVSMLKQEYKDGEMALPDTLRLAVKVLSKTLDITKLTTDKGLLTLASLYKSWGFNKLKSR